MSELLSAGIIGFGLGFFVAVAFCHGIKNRTEQLLNRSKELNEETKQLQAGITAQKQRLLLRLADQDGNPLVELSKN